MGAHGVAHVGGGPREVEPTEMIGRWLARSGDWARRFGAFVVALLWVVCNSAPAGARAAAYLRDRSHILSGASATRSDG